MPLLGNGRAVNSGESTHLNLFAWYIHTEELCRIFVVAYFALSHQSTSENKLHEADGFVLQSYAVSDVTLVSIHLHLSDGDLFNQEAAAQVSI